MSELEHSETNCATCRALGPLVPGAARHDGEALPDAGPVELVLHGDRAEAHDFHTGRPGSFEATLSVLARERSAGRTVLVTVPLTRSTYRLASSLPLLLRARGVSGLRFFVPALAEGAHETLVPRLALAVPFALHAIAVAERLGLPAFLAGAPLCLLGPLAKRRLETAARSYAPTCEDCRGRSACPGVDPRYLSAYGPGELRPLPAAPPPTSGHPIGLLFSR